MARISEKTLERANARIKYEEAKRDEQKARSAYNSAIGDPVKRAKEWAKLKEAQFKRQQAGRIMRGKRS